MREASAARQIEADIVPGEGLESQPSSSKKNDIFEAEKKLGHKLSVFSRVQLARGFKTLTEDVIVLLIWSSALYKMNLQSLLDLALVLVFQIGGRTPQVMRFIMHTVSVMFVIRIFLTLSNMTDKVSPMSYPNEF